jgi:transcriptional regulator with XRE-family HTH domain
MSRCAVYRIWRDAELLYIGASYNPWARYGNHQAAKDWGKSATRMDIQWFDTREAALRTERLAISTEKPPCNSLDVSGDIACKAVGRAKPLAEWLAQTGMTQADFAAAVGFHFTAMSRVMNNQRRPTKAVAQKIEAITEGAVPVSCWGFKTPLKHSTEFLGQVEQMFRQGRLVKEIATVIGVSDATVYNAIHALRLKRPKRAMTSKYEASLREMAAAGMSRTQAAERLGIAPAIVCGTASRLNIVFQDGRKTPREATMARVERVRQLAAAGLTVTQVAKEIGVAQPEVSRMKLRYQIEFPAYAAPSQEAAA